MDIMPIKKKEYIFPPFYLHLSNFRYRGLQHFHGGTDTNENKGCPLW